MRRFVIASVAASLVLTGLGLSTSLGRNALWSAYTLLRGRATIEKRIAELDVRVRGDVRRWCEAADVGTPPQELMLVAFKEERILHVYARSDATWHLVTSMPILGASGGPGPKLREGDGQVPEGVYPVESLNPNSRYHLALKVGYPNSIDVARAASDGRARLGGDIMIHGGSASIGCLALGDPAIERLFLLVAEVGVDRTRVVIAPCDLRRCEPPDDASTLSWLPELHAALRTELDSLPPVE